MFEILEAVAKDKSDITTSDIALSSPNSPEQNRMLDEVYVSSCMLQMDAEALALHSATQVYFHQMYEFLSILLIMHRKTD